MINLFYSFKSALKYYVNGGVVLIIATILALIVANTGLSEAYFSLWNLPVSVNIGDFNLLQHGGHDMTLMQFINDALMAIFFFAVGLEIKREILVGELSSPKQALLPIIAACGGMIVPVLLFILFAGNEDIMRGMAIPMATDIAFSLGILSMFGKRVPISLKVFLIALAVVDDIGGVAVIALFYSKHLALEYLLYSALLFVIILLGAKKGINSTIFYTVMGVLVWYMFLNSGIHPTIAGVLVAFCIPARPGLKTGKYITRIQKNISKFPVSEDQKDDHVYILKKEQIELLKSVESASDLVISPLQKLEDTLNPIVNYFIIPVFAFANAGISLEGMQVSDLFAGVSIAVLMGLVAGKFLGILSFSYLAAKLKLVTIPSEISWSALAGVALLGGIGFTVSIFIANLSYGDLPDIGTALLTDAKLGILSGSLIAGVLGYLVLNLFLPKNPLKRQMNIERNRHKNDE
ncbi:MAG TPA: Na+/H+ antiporter NhaA [Candidatus Avirikenella pullistercoris]|nr:Na+/H+ antiporter NhaA [Candidatus Avirikenella pullistercoris]